MASKIDSFAALERAVKHAGRAALEAQGKRVTHPMFADFGSQLQSWTCANCLTNVQVDVGATEPFAPCQCMAEAEEGAKIAERELHLPYVIEAEWDRAGIPQVFKDSTFRNFEMRKGAGKARRTCREYAAEFDPRGGEDGLLLYGDPGGGKSRLAAATARAIMETNLLPFWFTTAADLVEEAKRWRVGSNEPNPIDRAVKAPLLILDDLANQNVTPFAQEQIYLVVDRRYRAGAPMIVTSNLDDAKLRTVVGATLVSRLLEVCRWVKVTAADYRIEHRANLGGR